MVPQFIIRESRWGLLACCWHTHKVCWLAGFYVSLTQALDI